MAQHVPELLTVLSEKRSLLEELLLILEAERRCIVEMDMEGLGLQVSKKSELFVALEASSAHCARLIQELAVEFELPEATSLSPLLPKLEGAQKEALQGVQRGLLELGAVLEKMLVSNAYLLQGALQTVSRTLDFFGRLFTNSSTYGYAGQMVGSGGVRPSIICREA